MNKSVNKKTILAAVAVIPLVALLAGCAGASNGAATGTEDDVIKIGVIGASDPYWDIYQDAAADEGISIELVDFADYQQLNPTVSEGELDMNQFQHLVFLADYNVSSGSDLVPIGSTAIYPLGLYSTEYDGLDEIQEGDTVAVPNDATNLARALLLLQAEDLITLDGGGTNLSGLDDIDEENSKVTVTALEPSLTAASLADVAAAVINNDFVEKAGLTFEGALAADDPTDAGAFAYINVFAARAEDKDNETFLKLIEIFQTNQDVQDGLMAVSGDTAVPLAATTAELEAALADVTADVEAAK
ncbi:MetQ/NlpA family ABC transporter substrate-binding protein [Cryobacterium glaciale]|uniref:MetQ/NlpA family ABC transporter substrate-binding protein n=1 Tax=Cryobacterium glaciale TaxID=1259145 RepID=UPI001F540148|nr:MetQ/NlpA family ABC transporter substrate-binding protein [Cryobacterium glaciale]